MTAPGKRKVERLTLRPADTGRVEWVECLMGELVEGDIFRTLEPGDAGQWVPTVCPLGEVLFACGQPEERDGVWGVASMGVNAFNRARAADG